MKNQNQIVLSIGTNVGEKLKNIELAIAEIHNSLATVVRISNIYQCKSIGFDGDDFYNCAILIHSDKTAIEVLSSVLEIEKKLGRERNNSGKYENRIIDIDLIAFNDEHILEDNLQIPHPKMHERKFVLQPFIDLRFDWKHPIFEKNVKEMIAECEDNSELVFVKKIFSPLQEIDFSSSNYLVIEGNIGAGKTTLTNRIAEDFNAKTVLERFADNPFLPKFYQDQHRYAFPLEMSFLADRFQQISDDLAQFDLFHDFVVADYHIFKSLLFAKVTLPEDEFRLYRKLFEIIYKEMPKPDLYIYLYQNTEHLLENIKKRGRSYEQEIEADYLEKINLGYLDFIKTQTDLNVLVIDITDKNFVKYQEDYIFILDEIKKKLG